MPLDLKSPVIRDGNMMPSKYTCDGDDVSPPLTWSGAPEGTKSYVLIFDDKDAPAGSWDHWVLYNIPGDINSLDENAGMLPPPTLTGLNSWGNHGYGGPCPPDTMHRYVFYLYALDRMLELPGGAERGEVETLMAHHILSHAELNCRYEKGYDENA